MRTPARHSQPGRSVTLGRYRLLGVLGQGGMGRLYVAEQKGIEGFSKIVAVKQILPHLADSPEFRRMFLTEARIAARLDHPNIVATYELAEVDGIYFIAMEYLPGEDLGAVLALCRQTGPMPIEVGAAIAQQALSGLQYAHETRDGAGHPIGLVHRDVNPSNIFLTYYGMVKLLDFGVVKGGTTAATSPGLFKGKFGYCAVEQLEGDTIDRRTDLFCVGIVLWECLTGQRLFAGATDATVIDAVRSQRIVPPSTFRPEIPAELDALTMRALARDRRQRFQSAFEMSEALDRFLVGQQQRQTSQTISQWLEKLFGTQRASLKTTIAQGRNVESALERLAAIVTASAERPSSQGSSVAGSRPSRQPRALWSTSVRRAEQSQPSQPAVEAAAPAPPPAPFRKLEGDSHQDEDPTSRFDVPLELAQAAGFTPVSMAPVIAPAHSASEHSAAFPPPGGGLTLKIITLVGIVGTAAVVALTLRDAGDPASTVPSSVASMSGGIELTSDPAGAHVFIDGEPSGLSTPTTLRNLRPGRMIEVRLDKPGYQTVIQQMVVSAKGSRTPTFQLVAASGTLRLAGLPEGASVYVDEVLADASGPLTVPLGPRRIRVESRGEVVFERTIDAQPGEQAIKVRPSGRR